MIQSIGFWQDYSSRTFKPFKSQNFSSKAIHNPIIRPYSFTGQNTQQLLGKIHEVDVISLLDNKKQIYRSIYQMTRQLLMSVAGMEAKNRKTYNVKEMRRYQNDFIIENFREDNTQKHKRKKSSFQSDQYIYSEGSQIQAAKVDKKQKFLKLAEAMSYLRSSQMQYSKSQSLDQIGFKQIQLLFQKVSEKISGQDSDISNILQQIQKCYRKTLIKSDQRALNDQTSSKSKPCPIRLNKHLKNNAQILESANFGLKSAYNQYLSASLPLLQQYLSAGSCFGDCWNCVRGFPKSKFIDGEDWQVEMGETGSDSPTISIRTQQTQAKPYLTLTINKVESQYILNGTKKFIQILEERLCRICDHGAGYIYMGIQELFMDVGQNQYKPKYKIQGVMTKKSEYKTKQTLKDLIRQIILNQNQSRQGLFLNMQKKYLKLIFQQNEQELSVCEDKIINELKAVNTQIRNINKQKDNKVDLSNNSQKLYLKQYLLQKLLVSFSVQLIPVVLTDSQQILQNQYIIKIYINLKPYASNHKAYIKKKDQYKMFSVSTVFSGEELQPWTERGENGEIKEKQDTNSRYYLNKRSAQLIGKDIYQDILRKYAKNPTRQQTKQQSINENQKQPTKASKDASINSIVKEQINTIMNTLVNSPNNDKLKSILKLICYQLTVAEYQSIVSGNKFFSDVWEEIWNVRYWRHPGIQCFKGQFLEHLEFQKQKQENEDKMQISDNKESKEKLSKNKNDLKKTFIKYQRKASNNYYLNQTDNKKQQQNKN